MPNRECNVTKRVQTSNGLRYCRVVLAANGRVKPDVVIVDDKPEKHAEGAYYLEWLPRELSQAIREHELTPELMSNMLQMHFEDQASLDRWLRQRWQTWFSQPYPE